MRGRPARLFHWLTVAWALVFFLGAGFRVLADCSSFGLPFADLDSVSGFCAAIAEAYYTGITNGTSATTFSPNANVTRSQMAAFTTRTLDASLARGSRRAALGQWWTTTPHYDTGLGVTSVGGFPALLASDGADVWVANESGTVSRVRASDGKKVEDWTDALDAYGVLVAMGRIFVTGYTIPGHLYMIDPSQTAGAVTPVSTNLGTNSAGIAFDGNKIWTANLGQTNDGSVSIITPGSTTPWAVSTVTAGFAAPNGILFDGTNIWVTDFKAGTLLKLDNAGLILKTVSVGYHPRYPAFDGHSIWVPNVGDDSLTVVRASDGAVLKTFSAANGNQNGLDGPIQAAFDGQRILVTNENGGLSLFKASDLSVIGNPTFDGVNYSWGACSNGVDFWVGLFDSAAIGRF